jgi:3-hydroxy-9,10-secoandrosta-1,3,5(10)-triene-9,17-dione monooxygenase
MAEARTPEAHDPVARAAEMRPLLARNVAQAEKDRRLPAENIEALQSANLFKVMVPRRWGGYGATLPETLSTFAELAKDCPSTGWVAMIINGVRWWASRLPDRGQEEIFASADGSRACAAGSPTRLGRSVDGGIRISGKFPFASGCRHSSWGGLGVPVEDDAHHVIDQLTAFAPMSELEIEDTWFVAGMRGTGSNTLVAKDVFVPHHRVLLTSKLLSPDPSLRQRSGEPSDKYAFAAATTLIGISPVMGIAQALLEKVLEGTRTRGITMTTYARQADAPVVQHQIADAALKIDAACLQALNCAEEIENGASAGREMDYIARARARGIAGFAAKLLREAIDELVSIGGASGFADSSPLQRMWRDANIATRHALLATDPALEIYGRALIGAEGNISPFV